MGDLGIRGILFSWREEWQSFWLIKAGEYLYSATTRTRDCVSGESKAAADDSALFGQPTRESEVETLRKPLPLRRRLNMTRFVENFRLYVVVYFPLTVDDDRCVV